MEPETEPKEVLPEEYVYQHPVIAGLVIAIVIIICLAMAMVIVNARAG